MKTPTGHDPAMFERAAARGTARALPPLLWPDALHAALTDDEARLLRAARKATHNDGKIGASPLDAIDLIHTIASLRAELHSAKMLATPARLLPPASWKGTRKAGPPWLRDVPWSLLAEQLLAVRAELLEDPGLLFNDPPALVIDKFLARACRACRDDDACSVPDPAL